VLLQDVEAAHPPEANRKKWSSLTTFEL